MGHDRLREPRRPVKIGARLKSQYGWSDVVIRNVSTRGIMGVCPAPPQRGDYVEVRCGTYVIVARVAWHRDGSFGAQAQARIELEDLLAGRAGRSKVRDRRKLPREDSAAPRKSVAEIARASSRLGRLFDFACIAFLAVVFAAAVASQAYAALARPLGAAADALAPAARHEMLGNYS